MKRKEEKAKKATQAAQLQEQSQKFLRKLVRSFLATWKLYRSSKTGLIGLAIVIAFLVMAIGAPIISPFGPTFTAPAVDIFIADNAIVNLQDRLNWTAPVGLTEATREEKLTRVMIYSKEGPTVVLPITSGSSPTTGEPGIIVGQRTTMDLPSNASYINYAHFAKTIVFILKKSIVYEYTYELVDSEVEWDLGYEPEFVSNVWNGYSSILNQGRLAIVFADKHNVTLIDKRPPNPLDNAVRTYISNITIPNATITANPLVVDANFENGSMIILPTDAGLVAYGLNVTKGEVTGYVSDVRIGDLMWTKEYAVNGEPFQPIASKNMITYPYPRGATGEDGKTVAVVASTDGRVVAYDRENGTIMWANKLIMPSIRDYTVSSLYPSPEGIMVVGKTGERGFVARLNPTFGVVALNNSAYTSTEGYINSAPQYVPGQYTYLLSTDVGRIYLLNLLLRINATFGAPGGGAATPVSFVGNIYTSSIIGGNYFAVVTNNNSIYLTTLSGVNVAPLPPGTYPSGNRYLLGTDYEGHDILAWLVYGTRSELLVGVTAAFFSVVIGTIVGLVAGFYAGLIDDLLMRATDVVLSLPYLVIMLLFAAVFGPSLLNIIIIIGILSWAGIARVIRSVTLSLKERAFVDAAIIAGASDSRLIFKHIAPNVLPYTFLYMTFNISGAIVTEAILAFLGFGDVNAVTWGMMLQFLQISGHSLDAPWWLLPPGIAITLLSLSFYLIGRAFDEVVNPRLRKR